MSSYTNLFGLISHLDLDFMDFYLGNLNFYVSINNTLSALHFIICGIIYGPLLSGDATVYATAHHP